MGMVVRSNIMALNANRQLGMNNSQVSKSLEKLSSGFKINRAGDDASGLAISEKMKAQIKALDTASANCQDGISLVQTAEGALTEVHDMLNRMVELAGKSANGTMETPQGSLGTLGNGGTDRDALQEEMDALCKEIDRIADSTNFNGIKLLDGTLGGGAGATTPTETAPVEATVGAAVGGETTTVGALTFADGLDDEAKKALNDVLANEGLTFALSNGGAAGDTVAAPTLTGYTVKMYETDGTTETTTTADLASISIEDAEGNVVATMDVKIENADTDGNVTVSFAPPADAPAAAAAAAAGDADGVKVSGPDNTAVTEDTAPAAAAKGKYTFDLTGIAFDKAGTVTVKLGDKEYDVDVDDTMDADAFAAALKTVYDKDPLTDTTAGDLIFTANNDGTFSLEATNQGTFADITLAGSEIAIAAKAEEAPGNNAGNNGSLTLQIGEDGQQWNQMDVSIDDMHVSQLFVGSGITIVPNANDGADTIDISSQKAAQSALDAIRTAVNTVSTQRAKLGAIQNRLEHTINNLDVASENMNSANSRVRDTDMAKQMMSYTQMNVLTQAAQAMLAQANQQPQSVLQLLQ